MSSDPTVRADRLLAARAHLHRNHWKQVTKGVDGLGSWIHRPRKLGMIHSVAYEMDGELWEHVSLSREDGKMPTWEQTRDVFHEVCGPNALGIIVVPPKEEHVNIAEVAHIWHCLTRRPLPDFTRGLGTI
ncbi:MAG TPA: hypothetical protein VGH56_08620 [Solirubrobacteraceae bacterium]|jgi:hypothetical protein